jgi:glucosamine--fructose-6-phosphate aminotransferase (isomerizing)
MELLLNQQDEYKKLAHKIASADDYIFLGFGPMFGVAKEAALKVHQMVTVCAQGFSTSEFHHGPIATVKPETPIIMFVPDDIYLERNRQIYSRLLSRDAKVIVVTDRRREEFSDAMSVISIPHAHLFGYPVVSIMSIQMLLSAVTSELGINVDQPRHLQKVVNVE